MGIQINGQTDTVTATDGSINVGGDVTIPGVLTYEDVTNVDSVGVITARDGIRVTDGSVGIGTDNPEGVIHVLTSTNNQLVLESVDLYADIIGADTGGSTRIRSNNGELKFFLGGDGSSHNATNSSQKLRITGGGRVGLGSNISSPQSVLHVFSNSSTDTVKIQAPTSSGDYDAGFEVLRDTTAGGAKMVAKRNTSSGGVGWEWYTTSNNTAEVNATYTSRMVLNEAGKVGIGTDNPGEILHLTTTSGNCKLRIDAASAASVDFYNAGTRFSDMFTDAGTGNFTITNRQNADIIFRTNGTNERLRITSDGTLESYSTNDTTPNIRWRSNDTNWYGALNQSVEGGTITSFLSCGGDWSANGAAYSATKALAAYPTSAIAIHNQYNNTWGSQFVFLTKAGGSTTTDGAITERLRINSAGDVNIPGGILNLGTADVSSGHINSPELMSFNIDTDNDDTNRYFIFKKDAATNAGTELMRLTEGGNLGIGGVDPATGDGGNSNYNNWDIPKLHVKGATNSGKFHLLGRFVSGVDADSTGAQIVIHHENDRGMALQGGRSSGNRSYGAIKSLDNLSRESNVMVFTGGNGQGVENIKFYTNGGSTGTNERMAINTYGTVHTGRSTLITQTSLKPDLITQAGVVSPMFYRPFGGMSGAPSTSGPGYVDFGTGGVRHNLVDPHLGASYGGAQFQGGLLGSYSQTFSNTVSGTTREAMSWNRIRLLFRGLCLSTSHSPPTVKFRYSTYHYSNGWTDHSGTEWSFSGTEQARGGRWVVGPWINPSSYFTSWADVPGFGLYYNDNSSGKTFRIAGGVYFQFAHFI